MYCTINIVEEEEIEWIQEVMNGVIAARTTLDTARRPRGTRANPALSCRDLRTAHSNFSDGK